MRSRLIALALAGALIFVSSTDGGSVQFGTPDAHANVFKKIGDGFNKFGSSVKKGFQRFGKNVKKGFQKVGTAFKKLGKKALAFLERIKDKVVNKMKSFLPKAMASVKKLGATILRTVIEKVTAKLGFTLADFFKVVNPETGKVDTKALSWLIVQRIGEFVKPIMTDKVQILVGKGLRLIQKPLDIAVSAILGGVGSIPFAGGALVTAIHAAYTFGMDFLRDSLAETLSGLFFDKVVAPLFRSGLNKLFNLSPKIKQAVDKLMARATKFFQYIKPPQKAYTFSSGTGGFGDMGRRATMTKAQRKAEDAAAKASADKARAELDAKHRSRGLHVERNVHGKVTSRRIYGAQRRAGVRRSKRERRVKRRFKKDK